MSLFKSGRKSNYLLKIKFSQIKNKKWLRKKELPGKRKPLRKEARKRKPQEREREDKKKLSPSFFCPAL
jgi:hypothetical protein